MTDLNKRFYWGKYHSFVSGEEIEGFINTRMIWIGPMTQVEMKSYFGDFRHQCRDRPPNDRKP